MMEKTIKGKVWKAGNGVTAYDIIQQPYWDIKNRELNMEKLGAHALEGLFSADSLKKPFVRGDYSLLLAGESFGGGGKSIVHPVIAVKNAGIKLVIAESFSRYFYRNAVNLALPVVVCHGIADFANTEDELEIDLKNGGIKNLTSGSFITCEPIIPLVQEILKAGGAINYYCKTCRV